MQGRSGLLVLAAAFARADAITLTSDGSAERPYCTWASTCSWDTATKAECALKLCEASGYTSGTFLSSDGNMCTNNAGHDGWHWITDYDEYRDIAWGSEAGITADCGGGSGAEGDPHLTLPHGAKADFRGEHKTYYNFLSAKNLALNAMTELTDFELHEATHSQHKVVHGSFLTQAHVVVRTNTGKMVRASFYADMISEATPKGSPYPINYGWANGTIDSGKAFTITPQQTTVKTASPPRSEMWPAGKLKVDEVTLTIAHSSLNVSTREFDIIVKPMHFSEERNVVGLHHRLDIQIKPRVAEEAFAVAPHGIIGQGWDGDGKAINGERDAFPTSGEFTTYAMAKGAIEGVPSDYKVSGPYATEFKFARFDATAAAPRNVAALVAAGELNPPVKMTGDSTVVGATEYNFTNI